MYGIGKVLSEFDSYNECPKIHLTCIIYLKDSFTKMRAETAYSAFLTVAKVW
jgi:hypothetical protein